MIHVHILRVSTDSAYLEIKVECPDGYRFTLLTVDRYDVTTHQYETTTYDVSHLLVGTSVMETLRIATSAFGTDTTMYKVTFGVSPVLVGGAAIENEIGICSNVNFLYANMLDLVMAFTDCCLSATDYDNLDRNMSILYAHQEAMRLGREIEAQYFYDVIWNLFTNCGPTTRQNNIINKPCNCQ